MGAYRLVGSSGKTLFKAYNIPKLTKKALEGAGWYDTERRELIEPGNGIVHASFTDDNQSKPAVIPVQAKVANTTRRRLTAAELLHRHRLTTPYRDSPVLVRLLQEIRGAQ